MKCAFKIWFGLANDYEVPAPISFPITCFTGADFNEFQTRMQAINPNTSARYSGITQAMRTIVAKEGLGRTFHGMPAVIAGAGPAHAMYFACYEKIKWMLSERKQSTLSATCNFILNRILLSCSHSVTLINNLL